MSSSTYRCYVKYTREHKWRDDEGKWHKKTRQRKSKYIFVSAMSRESAIQFMRENHVKPNKGETVEDIYASAWKEDRALRAMGAKELPLKFD